MLATEALHFVDCGTSGGVWGLERGFCLMIGAEDPVFAHLEPIFRALAPGVDVGAAHARAAPANRRRRSTATCTAVRPAPGHFVKMVHNGIEYALMESYAEGLNVLHHANAGLVGTAEFDAETAPLREPELYRYEIDSPRSARCGGAAA